MSRVATSQNAAAPRFPVSEVHSLSSCTQIVDEERFVSLWRPARGDMAQRSSEGEDAIKSNSESSLDGVLVEGVPLSKAFEATALP